MSSKNSWWRWACCILWWLCPYMDLARHVGYTVSVFSNCKIDSNRKKVACSRVVLIQSSAQFRHVCTHLLQWRTFCLSHSSAQASQILTQRLQNCSGIWLSVDISYWNVPQAVAHSLLIWTQLAIILESRYPRAGVAKNSKTSAHLMQAAIKLIRILERGVSPEPNYR